MTIEEFREFGWKAGMRVAFAKNYLFTYDVYAVDFGDMFIETWFGYGDDAEVDRVRPEQIAVVLNPDGTVAWRKE